MRKEAERRAFQSPSLRGSGRFSRRRGGARRDPAQSFNPLHCGAVVASSVGLLAVLTIYLVSIPFIAGQWSLRAAPGAAGRATATCFNPLHCGAVVASHCTHYYLRKQCRCFNPLHCGAVVASQGTRSIPIVGDTMFQSPSLRGSGRFVAIAFIICVVFLSFNPLHCGAVVASLILFPARDPFYWVSIPFIAGQWSLPASRHAATTAAREFQSPSLRGSGRFSCTRTNGGITATGGFNPLHCGAVVASRRVARVARAARAGFNPLHCGAVVASGGQPVTCWPCGHVSIPFIAGQWSLLPRTTPSSLFGVLLRKRRLPCDHIICTRLPF